ncbi:hypothetical protein EPYR_03885 [Erwinia pyrifoliae DSM 12163]|nr:hypothetical protein EPYR_03885 [Erwinia pyrifoliae DSM 12163]
MQRFYLSWRGLYPFIVRNGAVCRLFHTFIRRVMH